MSFSSAGSSVNANAAEITADTYTQTISYNRYYLLSDVDDNVIEEIYSDPQFSRVVGDSYSFLTQFPTWSNYLAVVFFFDFADSKYTVGQTYNFEFNLNTSSAVTYTYFFPHYIPATFTDKFFSEGDLFHAWRIHDNFCTSLDYSDAVLSDMHYQRFDAGTTHISFPISIPSDFESLSDDILITQNRVIVYAYISCYASESSRLPSHLTLSNIRLVPTGATQQLYSDKVFQNELLGSDEEGSESGIKGIFKKLSELPSQISSFISNLGTRIGSFFTQLKVNLLQGIKDLFVPSEEDITIFKDDMDELLSDHLGVVYEAPDLMVSFVKRLADFSPQRSDDMNDYYIEFPSKTIYLTSDFSNDFISDTSSNGGEVIPVVPDNTGQGTFRISFGLFNDKPYSTFYSIYNVFIIFFTILCFCNYAIRKYEKIMED